MLMSVSRALQGSLVDHVGQVGSWERGRERGRKGGKEGERKGGREGGLMSGTEAEVHMQIRTRSTSEGSEWSFDYNSV